MQAFFIGQTYIDVTFLTDRMPTGDEKHVASAYAVSFGGNAVTAASCCAKLSIAPALLATVADDWLGRMFLEMAAKYRIVVHPRNVKTSSLSFIMPNDGKRATGAVHSNAALAIPPERIVDTSGAGDVFHGAYVYSYLAASGRTWAEHFQFARAAAAYKVQRLGNEAGLPTLQDIEAIRRELEKPP
jgi:sugar/nucleoside kinase (ribokinase family)